jgi:zinc transport system substrate-binding protein
MEWAYPGACKSLGRVVVTLAIYFSGLFLVAGPADAQSFAKLRVMTSLFPLQEFAQAVGGKRVSVRLLLPPGAEPHTWEPRPSDIGKLATSDILIYVGAEMEPWIQDMVKGTYNPNLSVLEVSRGLNLIRGKTIAHNHKTVGFDPHVWLDFDNAQNIVNGIAKAFIEKDPQGTKYYGENARFYREKLQVLDSKFRQGLRNCLYRVFVVGGHAAYSYLADRYGLIQIPLYGINPNSEPTPKQLARVIRLAKEHHIKVVYFEISVSDKLAEVIAEEVGAKTLVLNSGANLTKEQLKSGETFISLMEKNLENLRRGLACK